VILVHRIKGEPLYLNADLIEFVESTPDTVITLADGRKMIVAETPVEVVDLARVFRASVIVAADQLGPQSRGTTDHAPSGVLKLLPTASDYKSEPVEAED
jgi:flagellar protein FlbD